MRLVQGTVEFTIGQRLKTKSLLETFNGQYSFLMSIVKAYLLSGATLPEERASWNVRNIIPPGISSAQSEFWTLIDSTELQ